jgi:hypothetical protein
VTAHGRDDQQPADELRGAAARVSLTLRRAGARAF